MGMNQLKAKTNAYFNTSPTTMLKSDGPQYYNKNVITHGTSTNGEKI